MRYENDDLGFSFELPDGWRRDEHNLTITFYGPNGRVGVKSEVIQVMIGGISPDYVDPANRERFLSEPGADVARTEIGGERNAVILRRTTNSEISVVRDGVHYSFSYSNDAATQAAIERIRHSAQFPSATQAAAAIRRSSDPKKQAVSKALRADSPEEARRILAEGGVPGVRRSGYTIHSVGSEAPPSGKERSTRWWEFWK